MPVQDRDRVACPHALCVPADVQQVSRRQASAPTLGVQPRPGLIARVVFTNNMCDSFTAEETVFNTMPNAIHRLTSLPMKITTALDEKYTVELKRLVQLSIS